MVLSRSYISSRAGLGFGQGWAQVRMWLGLRLGFSSLVGTWHRIRRARVRAWARASEGCCSAAFSFLLSFLAFSLIANLWGRGRVRVGVRVSGVGRVSVVVTVIRSAVKALWLWLLRLRA